MTSSIGLKYLQFTLRWFSPIWQNVNNLSHLNVGCIFFVAAFLRLLHKCEVFQNEKLGNSTSVGLPVWARELGSLSAFLGLPLPQQTAALVMVPFLDFHGKRFWRPQPLTKTVLKGCVSKSDLERNGLLGKVGPEVAGSESRSSRPKRLVFGTCQVSSLSCEN